MNPNTFAVLTNMSEGLVTESQLHITVSGNILISTVTCNDVSGGSMSSLRFELLRKCIISIIFLSALSKMGCTLVRV